MGDENDTSSVTKKERVKPVLISGFYISQTEITNAQYREFVHWVRDSIAARILGGEYIKINGSDTAVNWKLASKINYNNPQLIERLGDFFIDPSRSVDNKRSIDPKRLVYLMHGFNYLEAAKKENRDRNPTEFIYKYEIPIYPDTLCWLRDFGYSNNEHMAVNYFSSPKYQNFPVVGVSWNQANAFCDWITKQKSTLIKLKINYHKEAAVDSQPKQNGYMQPALMKERPKQTQRLRKRKKIHLKNNPPEYFP